LKRSCGRLPTLCAGTLTFTRDASGLVVSLPEQKRSDYAHALKVMPK
jgi:hypothetical protein